MAQSGNINPVTACIGNSTSALQAAGRGFVITEDSAASGLSACYLDNRGINSATNVPYAAAGHNFTSPGTAPQSGAYNGVFWPALGGFDYFRATSYSSGAGGTDTGVDQLVWATGNLTTQKHGMVMTQTGLFLSLGNLDMNSTKFNPAVNENYFGIDYSLGQMFFGPTAMGGWGGNNMSEVAQFQWGQAVSAYLSYTGGGGAAFIGRVDSTSGLLADYYYQGGGGPVGNISTNGSTISYNATSSEKVKENIQPMDVSMALDVLRAYDPKSFTHKKTGTVGHGFVVEHFATNMAALGHDAHAMGLVHIPFVPADAVVDDNTPQHLPGMDYSKVTPFLVSVILDQQTRLSALESAHK